MQNKDYFDLIKTSTLCSRAYIDHYEKGKKYTDSEVDGLKIISDASE